MSALTVRMYNVGFGDAILVTIPDRHAGKEVRRHVLIDLGNLLASDATVFGPIAADLMSRTEGRNLDLYVMTHEHLDHVHGLKYLAGIGTPLPVDYVWLTASADPRYGRKFPEAKRAMDSYLAATDRLRPLAVQRGLMGMKSVEAFFANNDHRSTAKCVEEIRRTARIKTSFVHRRFPLRAGRDHPFREASLKILAPEHNTANYYGRMRPLTGAVDDAGDPDPTAGAALERLSPPAGIDPTAFANLIAHLSGGVGDWMLAIDKARNDTSVVLQIEWRGWRLLFAADAEHKSWRHMHRPARGRRLQPVHFLKVSHHGSRTGMPGDEAFDVLLPPDPPDDRPRYAAVSTHDGHWDSVPDGDVLDRVRSRVTAFFDTSTLGDAGSLEISFPGRASAKPGRP